MTKLGNKVFSWFPKHEQVGTKPICVGFGGGGVMVQGRGRQLTRNRYSLILVTDTECIMGQSESQLNLGEFLHI